MTQKRYTEIPKRQKCINKEEPYIGGTKDIIDDELNKPQSQVNQEEIANLAAEVERAQQAEGVLDGKVATEKQRAEGVEGGLNTRLQTVEQLAEISVGGGDIGIGTAADFESDDPEDLAKVPTVGAMLGGANDGVYDISARHSGTKYADLAAALGTNGANVPVGVRKGGMSVKYVQSSDNKYIQARCMAQNFTTDVTQWQGVDSEITDGSKNLAESDSVYSFANPIKALDGTIVNTYGDEVCTYDGYVYTSEGLVNSGDLQCGHTTNAVPVPDDADCLIVTNFFWSAFRYYFVDENDEILCNFKTHSLDEKVIIVPIPAAAKGFLCNTLKTNKLKLVFFKSSVLNLLKWDTSAESNVVYPCLIYEQNALYAAMDDSNAYGVTAKKDKIYKFKNNLFVFDGTNFVPVYPADKFNLENDFGYSVFSKHISPEDWTYNQLCLSCERSAKGIDRIKLVSWGTGGSSSTQHVLFSAKDSNGNIIESSKVYSPTNSYKKEVFEIPILSNYATYVAGHITNQPGCPADNEASLTEYKSLKLAVEELIRDTRYNKDFDYTDFNGELYPGNWEYSQFSKSCERKVKGVSSITLTSWGLTSHVVFSAKDSSGNIIESSKVFAHSTNNNYVKETFEIPILPSYDTYIVGYVHDVPSATAMPNPNEANFVEKYIVNSKLEAVSDEVDELRKDVDELKPISDFVIDESFFYSTEEYDFIKDDGTEGHSGICKFTDYIDCSEYNQLELNVLCTYAVWCAFYLADKTMFSVFQTGATSTSTRTHKIVAIPEGVKYVRLSNINTHTNPNAVLRKVSNWWENRKIAIYGTSVPAGYNRGCYEQQIEDGLQDIYGFVNVAIRRIGAIPLNYCVPSGAMRASKVNGQVTGPQYAFASDDNLTPDFGPNGLQNVTYRNSMLSLIDTNDEPDLFLFAVFGPNDVNMDNTDFQDGYTPDYTSIQANTFVGAYNKVMKALYEANPNARAAIITSTIEATGDNDYIKNANDQTVAIARLWEAPCLKLHEMTGLIANGIIDNRPYWFQGGDRVHSGNFNKKRGTELIPRLATLTEKWLLELA